MKSSLNRLALIALAPFSLASTSLGIDSKFETALKWEIYSNHQRHTPKVTISGDEVKLTYIHGEQWTKDSAHDDTAKFDVLTCFKADYAALKADPRHRLHDYFHVVEYSTWSHEIIGEATLKRTDYPSAEAVDGAIARTQAEWETELQNHLKQTPDTDTRTTIPASTGDNFPVPYGEAFIINTNVYAARFRQVLFDIKTYQKANDEQAIAETLRVPSGMDSLAEAIEIKKGTTVYYMGLDPFVDQKIIKVRFFGSGQTWDVLAADLKDFRYNNRDYTSFLGSYSPIEK